MQKKALLKIFANTNIALGVIAIIASTITVLFVGFPKLFFFLNINSTEIEMATLTQSLDTDFQSYQRHSTESNEEIIEENKIPELDFSLPNKRILNIPKINVSGEIYEGEDYDELLEKGIWRINDFGTPESNSVMILTSHRFGHISWTNDYRNKNSFFNLPKTTAGDYIEIVWDQRLYTYEVYKVEESLDISDYDADLILYTCKLFNSPVRIFRYANRTN
jgi:LPXTG-site transpeptidase (sortase) family protein